MPSLQSLFSTNSGITDAELTTYSHTTASLADDASSTYDFTIAKSALIKKVTSSVPSRLRLYSSSVARTADSRDGATTTNPPEGLLIDVEFTATPDSVLFTPLEIIGNQESPLNSTIYAKIFNLSGGASTVAIDIEAYSLSQQINSANQREVLTADRTYYVNSSTGNDNNDGLSSENAFLTIQKAIDTACSLDNSIYQTTIQITGNFLITQPINLNDYIGSKPPIILGDVVNPTNSSVSATTGFNVPSTSTNALFSCNANKWIIKGVAGFSDGNAVYGFSVYAFGSQSFSTLYLENCLIKSNSSLGFGLKLDMSTLIIVTKLKIDATNSYDYFINCGFNAILDAFSATLEIVNGTASWNTCFILGRMGGQCSFQSTIFTGSASGPRVNLNEYSVVRYSNTIFGSTNGSVQSSLLKTI